MSFLSLLAICRNEEKTIARFLRSHIDIVDEVVLVDTGSTDQTLKIALEFPVNIKQIPWEDDFSKARNYAFHVARGDWFLLLDIDEIICPDDIHKVIPLAKLDTYDVVNFKLHHFHVDYERIPADKDFAWSSVKTRVTNKSCLIRNQPGIFYRGMVHESIVYPQDAVVRSYNSSIRVGHYRDKKTLSDRAMYYHDLEKRSVIEEWENTNAHYNFVQTKCLNNDREAVCWALNKMRHIERRFRAGFEDLYGKMCELGWDQEADRLHELLND